MVFQLAEDEEQLNQLLAVQDLLEEGETEEFEEALKSFSLSNEADLIKMINNLQAKVERTRQKIVAANSQEDNIVIEEPKPKIKSILQPKDQQDFDEWISGVRKKRYSQDKSDRYLLRRLILSKYSLPQARYTRQTTRQTTAQTRHGET